MNIVSCDSCGVVLDLDKKEPLKGEEGFAVEDYSYGVASHIYKCPVCEAGILVEVKE